MLQERAVISRKSVPVISTEIGDCVVNG